MGFLEAIETEEQIKNAVKVLSPMPVSRISHRSTISRLTRFQLMVNLVSNGKTPWFSPAQLGEWGVMVSV
jgi:2-methylisocitrate lyase-like PEP mutase family enzyme